MTRTIQRGWLHMKLGTVLAALALVGFVVGGALLLRHAQDERMIIPDEKAAAAALLGRKLSGPRYFQPSSPAATDLRAVRTPRLRDGEPLISLADAQAQVDRLATERHLDAERTAKVRTLIERLAEPPDSRMVGEASVNLLRLNLALDELR